MVLVAIMMCISHTACSSDSKEEPAPPQKKPIEEFNQGNMSFTEGAGEQSFSFVANEAWTISVAATKADEAWCKVSPTSGGAGSHVVKITTTENTSYDDRSVTITLKSGSESKSFVVTQKQKDALLLTSDKVEIEQKGGTFTIEVKANVSYTATIGETCKSWITEGSNTRALSTSTKTYSVAASEESEKREGTITFTAGNLSETVHIYQAGGDIILLTQNEYHVDAAGENITVDLKSNCEYEVEMPNVDWIHTTSTRGMSSHTLYYTIDANEAYDSREAKINFRNKANNVVETLTIIQAQKSAIILGKKEVTVKSGGETIEVKLSTNVDYKVVMPEVDWISSVSTRGLTEHTLYYTVAKNESDDERVAKITFKNTGSNIEEMLTITQEGQMPVAKATIHVSEPGTLGNYIEEGRLPSIEEIKITGELNRDDLMTICKMTALKILDLSEADLSEKQIAEGQLPTNIEYFYAPKNLETISGSYDTENYYSAFCKRKNKFEKYTSNLKKIRLPNTLKTIGIAAFFDTKLKELNIPEGVSLIERAILKNTRLSKLTLPSSLETVAISALNSDNVYAPSLLDWLSIDFFGSIYSFDYTHIRELPSSYFLYINNVLLTSLTIPQDITSIKDYAFAGCQSLQSIKIGDQVKNIGLGAFQNCENLNSVTIGNKVDSIGERAFQFCDNLSQVTIGNNVKKIKKEAFQACYSLRQITIPDNIETIEACVFYGCEKLEVIHIGKSVKTIKENAFYNVPGNEVFCHCTTPPTFEGSIYGEFSIYTKENGKLYVPKGTYQAYYLSNWGARFENIIEMDE